MEHYVVGCRACIRKPARHVGVAKWRSRCRGSGAKGGGGEGGGKNGLAINNGSIALLYYYLP